MFWEALDYLHRWEREHLPGADTPQGSEVLVWLLKWQNHPKPLKDLYRSSRYSEPTIRGYLKVFVEMGFVVIEANGQDMRTRIARVTPKLEATIRVYRQRFVEVATLPKAQNAFANDGTLSLDGPLSDALVPRYYVIGVPAVR